MQEKYRKTKNFFFFISREGNYFSETALRRALFSFSIFIASVCTASTVITISHTPYSLTKKTICKMTTVYTETIFKMISSFRNNLRKGRTNDFPLWHASPAICKSPCVYCVCVSVWKRVIKDLNLTRQQNVSFFYPVIRAFLSISPQLIVMSCLLYTDPS